MRKGGRKNGNWKCNYGKKDEKIFKVYENLYWIFDKNSHPKVTLKSLDFHDLSTGSVAKVTLASGQCETLSFTNFPQLIEKIVQMLDTPRHKKEQMRRYLAAVKKKK